MILVLLGTQNNSFHRLLEEIDKLKKDNIIKDEIIVQAGYTKYESKNMRIFDLISAEKLDKLQNEANLIITHGGVGSIISSIKKEKKVIAIPRLSQYNEHVNDHQKEIIERFTKNNYIYGLSDVNQLKDAIKNIDKFEPTKYIPDNNKLLKIIEKFIDEI